MTPPGSSGRGGYFNPRSPHGERPHSTARPLISPRFQSTLPARGATALVQFIRRTAGNFNPRSPHGERPIDDDSYAAKDGFQSTLPARGATKRAEGEIIMKVISIHAPRTGSDVRPHQFLCVEAISIHAPRTGSDAAAGQHGSAGRYFNPRSPHGERRGRCGY